MTHPLSKKFKQKLITWREILMAVTTNTFSFHHFSYLRSFSFFLISFPNLSLMSPISTPPFTSPPTSPWQLHATAIWLAPLLPREPISTAPYPTNVRRSSWTTCSLKMGATGCPETATNICCVKCQTRGGLHIVFLITRQLSHKSVQCITYKRYRPYECT